MIPMVYNHCFISFYNFSINVLLISLKTTMCSFRKISMSIVRQIDMGEPFSFLNHGL